MPRAIWSGSISFGLVNVPVKLFGATSKKDVRFHQLHDADGARIQQKRVCSKDGEEVPLEHIVKGYEVSRDRYVLITPEELDSLDPKATRTIDIQDFVELDEIDPVYFDSTYYLVPEKGASKAYRLLLEAMRESKKVAIARVVLRQKQHLVALRPLEDALSMSSMLYADEVVSTDQLEDLPEDVEVSERELKMANQLIESLTSEWRPEQYRDDYRERVLELIEKKAAGQEIAVAAVEEEQAPVVDLMAALEASLAAAKDRRDEAPAEEAKPARARKRRSA
ncbi:MAG: Ku protein [Chloroflexi bacterium]|nr:MAG: Ku protein [Chloroflexota bacterium]TME15127.1 MAG: Ku protein [Chloroflexota bacterium]TME15704.1 MAG: Ku protein [Chloroflexota bacterium]